MVLPALRADACSASVLRAPSPETPTDRGDGSGALDEDERAELARLRWENAELR